MSLLKKNVVPSLLLLLFVSFVMGGSAMAIEKAKYRIVESHGEFELRRYESSIVAETWVDGDFDEVANEGFRRLVAYISGNNLGKQPIAMTAPVTQEASSEQIAMTAPVSQEQVGNSWRITFLMPSTYSMETLPEPLDERVVLKQIPGRLMAAIRYSGTWSRKRYEGKRALLMQWVQDRGWRSEGTAVWARYDPPFMPWFLRRNEVLVAVGEKRAE